MKKAKYNIKWKWIVLWSLWAARLVRQPTLPVLISSGVLRGSVSPDGTHLNYLGIPYATVEKRFQAPGPEPIWQGIFEAENEHIHCTQKWMEMDILSGLEECLNINVYTPLNVLSKNLLPVMVFIHGGGFLSGSGAPFMYGPHHLVSKGVVLVTFNYRLGILGQLCLRIKEVPGNAAMKDQVAALRWIQKNNRAFGGDPNDVTLFGESAGGVSVSYHILSPMSKGLFHKAILQSGSSLAGWVHQYSPVNTARKQAKALGCEIDDSHEIHNYFMKKTDRELMSGDIERKQGTVWLANIHFSPCVEEEFYGEEAFLKEQPYNLFTKGEYNKVPMIIGTNDEEGYFFMQFEKAYIAQIEFEKSMPTNLVFPSEEELKTAADRSKQMYMGDDKISIENLVKFSRFVGEPHFTYPSAEETELILNTSDHPIYSYLFNYGGRRNIVKFIVGYPISFASGASHADDLFYLFSQPWLPMLREKEMVDRLTTLWTNFAKYGNPTPDNSLGFHWDASKLHDPQTLKLGEKIPYTQPLWNSESIKYWKELYSKYRRTSD